MVLFWISLGAVCGAISRWGVGVWLNPLFNTFALGTLLVNWLGCFLIGLLMGFNLQDHHRFLFITGFLGSFTTFSSFSAELSEKLLSGKYLQGVGIVALHLLGGVALTLGGMLLARLLQTAR
ncbi:chromosome condensation protein CrcB [Pasteurellaceae bacterium Macca]|nr:chromosome condensation protein CrcB [Pasteurellaceae bacterium Macca]